MRIWNPFAFTPTGQPVAAVSPPALRVLGGTATAQQFLYAQAAFYKFSLHARLSVVPNPTEQGFLPDGSRYTIAVVGPQTTMTLWVSEGEGLRNSGIAFVLSHLDGQPIPEHSDEDGIPFTYLLTPREKKGTRVSSGRWAIRKPKFVAGGKAVNTDSSGLAYYTGVDGALDRDVPFYRGQGYSLNGQAYLHDEYAENAPLFQYSKKVGQSVSNTTPVPFIYKGSGTEGRLAMQLNVVVEFDPVRVQYIELLVGKFGEETNAPVGPVVSREDLPSDLFLNYQSITFSADGRTARAFGTKGGSSHAFIEIDITPVGTTTRVVSTSPLAGDLSGVAYYTSFKTAVTGAPGEPGYTTESWQIFGVDSDGPVEYGSTRPVTNENGGGESGTTILTQNTPSGHAFDRRGRPIDTPSSRRVSRFDGYRDKYEKSVVVTLPSETTPLHATYLRIDNLRRKQVVTTSTGALVVLDEEDYFELFQEQISSEFTLNVNGGGHWHRTHGAGTGHIILFEDDELDFSAGYEVVNTLRVSWTYVLDPSTAAGWRRDYSAEQSVSTKRLVVRCKGSVLLSESIPADAEYLHVVFIATDPMTGAMVVNLQQVNQFNRATLKSWIFVVDDTGARFLHEVMKSVAPGTHIKVRRNDDLISV